MSLLTATEIAVTVIVVALLVCISVIFARRRYLSRKGGVFDCEVRSMKANGNRKWADGLARYDANRLEWYRVLSLSFRPRVVLQRRGASMLDHRMATTEEAPVLFAGHQVVRVQVRSSNVEPRIWEMAMAQESLMGLMSWLEAAPPGGASYKEYD